MAIEVTDYRCVRFEATLCCSLKRKRHRNENGETRELATKTKKRQ